MSDIPSFIELSGTFFEGLGLTRMAGRIMGLLLVAEQPHLTMPDIVERLNVSKSAVSTALWQLQQVYLVERFTLPNERRDYFRLAPDVWDRAFRARMSSMSEMRQMAEKGLAVLADAPPSQRQRLELMRDMYSFMEREFPKLLDKWEAEKRAKGYPD